MSARKAVEKLIDQISLFEHVRSIGISGGGKTFPKKGEGDVDIFIYCESIPPYEERKTMMASLGGLAEEYTIDAIEGGHWGIGDYALVDGIETWTMYFTEKEAQDDIDAILKGEYPDKVDNYYYPVGRLAMLQSICILLDKDGFLCAVKDRLKVYPEELKQKLASHHSKELEDNEDLERAVMRRDVLFYHFALDIALDHFLQMLFALNSTFFPSRKKSPEHIASFKIKPNECEGRLLAAVKLGADSKTMEQSFSVWRSLCEELKRISIIDA